MNQNTIEEIDKAMTYHIKYNGNLSNKYLEIMDRLAVNYTGAPGIRVSKLCKDYYKAVGVKDLKEALERLRRINNV